MSGEGRGIKPLPFLSQQNVKITDISKKERNY
ncbi:hypothetical protein BBR47_07370 [Brevibacillus brevis NBRC 100599]|uniref:Uncharacterized protein n=1 Tax=Brevibacillus brevis (strain 47 / JCM 6285 / NBRC 100599) TaxID=358681 RepID=C0Z4I7_BREBN|nr:hypothetical protein BBR47_07370 [Brevibacillus brevis NBRC 100599]